MRGVLSLLLLLLPQVGVAQCVLTTVGPPTGAAAFGSAVASSADVLVAADPGGGAAGVIHRYVQDGMTWSAASPIGPGTSGGGASFGAALALEGGFLLVGAPTHNGPNGAHPSRGAVYAMELLGNSPGTPLTAPGTAPGDLFGSSLAWGTDLWVAGAPGALGSAGSVSIFHWSATTGSVWDQTIAPTDPQPWAQFGASVVMHDDMLVVGSPGADSFRGAVYVFERTGTTWQQVNKLTLASAQSGDRLGASIAVRTTGPALVIVAGAPGVDAANAADAGIVATFSQVGLASWTEGGLANPTPEPDAEFGADIAIELDRVLVGAPGQFNYQGAATLFRWSEGLGGGWTNEGTVGGTLGNFSEAGRALALVDGIAWLGARLAVGGGAVDGFVVADRDCDGNGTLDRCDVLQGLVEDVNENQVPDACEFFVRGDTDGDGATAFSDAVVLLSSLFLPWGEALDCLAAADVNMDSAINLTDCVFLLNVLYLPGTPPVPAPWPGCGVGDAAWSCEVPSFCP
ncbi:MAG: hypothetical protein AAF581_08775 [Planctomycetota bacterium]